MSTPNVGAGVGAGALPPVVSAAVASGKCVVYGEFRRGVAVEFGGKGGRLFHQTKCTVETESNGTVTVTEFLPDGADWLAWKSPFSKGSLVYCVVRNLEETSGVQIASGKLFAVVG